MTVPNSPEAGWTEILNVYGRGGGPEEGMAASLAALETILAQQGCQLAGLVRVVLYIADMADYPAINVAYARYFGLNPPVRVCVAVGRERLPPGQLLQSFCKSIVCGSEIVGLLDPYSEYGSGSGSRFLK